MEGGALGALHEQEDMGRKQEQGHRLCRPTKRRGLLVIGQKVQKNSYVARARRKKRPRRRLWAKYE